MLIPLLLLGRFPAMYKTVALLKLDLAFLTSSAQCFLTADIVLPGRASRTLSQVQPASLSRCRSSSLAGVQRFQVPLPVPVRPLCCNYLVVVLRIVLTLTYIRPDLPGLPDHPSFFPSMLTSTESSVWKRLDFCPTKAVISHLEQAFGLICRPWTTSTPNCPQWVHVNRVVHKRIETRGCYALIVTKESFGIDRVRSAIRTVEKDLVVVPDRVVVVILLRKPNKSCITPDAIVVPEDISFFLMNHDSYSEVLCCGMNLGLSSPNSCLGKQAKVFVKLSIFVPIQRAVTTLTRMNVAEW